MTSRSAILAALAAAALFGASTPATKLLLDAMSPWVLAGTLYLGSGVGLGLFYALQRVRRGGHAAPAQEALARGDLPWLAGAIAAGGIAGPVLLMFGLRRSDAASAALLLNLEGVFTALLAWTSFREATDRRVAFGFVCISAGALVLSWPRSAAPVWSSGAWLIAAACLCWAIDNNLTRRVASNDAVLIAGLKGLVAGATNLALGFALGGSIGTAGAFASAAFAGLLGYGVSLVLFVLALRHLGTARTGAYFSVAPFFGAALSLLIWPQALAPAFVVAGALMALGVWLHVSEHHAHAHSHTTQTHVHLHRHDEHHRHVHDFAWDGDEPHSHAHTHAALEHSHAHYPDEHHRHGH